MRIFPDVTAIPASESFAVGPRGLQDGYDTPLWEQNTRKLCRGHIKHLKIKIWIKEINPKFVTNMFEKSAAAYCVWCPFKAA